MLAGLRGEDRGIQREQIGLLGDVFDDIEDPADRGRALAETRDDGVGLDDGAADLFHRLDRFAHRFHARLCRLCCGQREVVGACSIRFHLRDGGAHLHHG